MRKSSLIDTDTQPNKKNKVINNEPKTGDAKKEFKDCLASVQPESPQVENSLGEISSYTTEVQDIPPSPTSQKLRSDDDKGELGSLSDENLSFESVVVDATFTETMPSQSPEAEVPMIIPPVQELTTNNGNNNNNEEPTLISNPISPIEHTVIQIPTIHLSEAEDDAAKSFSPLASEMLRPPNSILRVEREHPNQNDEGENDLQPEEAEWELIQQRYPGVYEEKNKLGEGFSGRVFKVQPLR